MASVGVKPMPCGDWCLVPRTYAIGRSCLGNTARRRGMRFCMRCSAGRVRQLWGAHLRRCGQSLGAALRATRQKLSCNHVADCSSTVSRAVPHGNMDGSSGVRSHFLLDWRREPAPEPACANGFDNVARSPSPGLLMRVFGGLSGVSSRGLNQCIFADGREEQRFRSSCRHVEAATRTVHTNDLAFWVLGDT